MLQYEIIGLRYVLCFAKKDGVRCYQNTKGGVLLDLDEATAWKVGSRHGKPVIYTVESGRMHQDGYAFFLSKNNVWLTKCVPAAYLRKDVRQTGTP